MSEREQRRAWVLSRLMAGELAVTEVAGLLGLSAGSIRRLRARVERHGPAGLVHGDRGRTSPRRLPEKTRSQVLGGGLRIAVTRRCQIPDYWTSAMQTAL